tara:strand:+ start:133 stop:672 length:540 start_codon:yes stop_codon:yes gene_type:complete
MSTCEYCGNNIPEGRLKIFPETNICSANCVNLINENFQDLQETIQRQTLALSEEYVSSESSSGSSSFKKFKEVFSPEHQNVLKELSHRKYTTIRAFNDFKNNVISKDEYKIKFKRFTWWIKEKVESIDGYLVDNPANYTECKKCGNLSLIQWTPKFQKYFIGCSNYSSGCNWVKTIWIL